MTMAQETTHEVKTQELRLAHHNLCTQFGWSFKNDNRFTHARHGTKISTDDKSFLFKLDQQGIKTNVRTDWYLKIHPNGILGHKNHVKGDFIVSLALARLPAINQFTRIKAVTAYYSIQIPQLGLRHDRTNVFNKDFLAWKWLPHLLKLGDLTKQSSDCSIKTLSSSGDDLTFDIKVSVTITSMTIEQIPRGNYNVIGGHVDEDEIENENENNTNNDINIKKRRKSSRKLKRYDYNINGGGPNRLLLQRIESLELTVSQMMNIIGNMNIKLDKLCDINCDRSYSNRNGNNNTSTNTRGDSIIDKKNITGKDDGDNKEEEDMRAASEVLESNNDNKNGTILESDEENESSSELKEWILSIFDSDNNNNSNDEIGSEYVKLIVDKEGFDKIDDFVELDESELKEIGIDKKGHRLKFLKKMRQYHENEDLFNASQPKDTEGNIVKSTDK